MLSRRAFCHMMAIGGIAWPLLARARVARAQSTAKRRLLIIHSMATQSERWRPRSAAGQPLGLGDFHAPLMPWVDSLLMLDGLTPNSTGENHETPQSLTGRGFGGQTWQSVDTFVARSLGLPSPVLLGIMASSSSQFYDPASSGGGDSHRRPVEDNPLTAYANLFGGAAAGAQPTAGANDFQEAAIVDLVTQQLAQLRGELGPAQQKKVDGHVAALARLAGGGQATPAAGCTMPMAPNLMGADPTVQSSTVQIGQAQAKLAVAALGCDLTRTVGLQWGTSQSEYVSGQLNIEMHGEVHTNRPDSAARVAQVETFLSTWFADLLADLKATADPTQAGKTLLDTTLIVWTRDFGHQGDGATSPGHANFSMPYVLAGATDYLKVQQGGTYIKFNGDNRSGTSGEPHERLLYNMCEAMGVTNFASDSFGSLPVGDRKPLTEIKA